MLNAKFNAIYKNATWVGRFPNTPLSGPGSSVENSEPVISFIQEKISQGEVKSILDLGCGDLTYISTVEEIVQGKVDYIGVDVSDYILQQNTQKFPWFTGKNIDATEPQTFEADLILMKDLLFHLTNGQIDSLLHNLSASLFKYCLLTSMNNASNKDRILDPKHNYADVNIKIEPFHCSRHVEALQRSNTANKGQEDTGEFLVFTPDSLSHFYDDDEL